MTTAAAALAGFAAAAQGSRVIGYCYAPAAACWFALDRAGLACRPAGPLDLSAVFELRATDGERELRWLHEDAGLGRSVILTGLAQPVSVPPQRRLLAGSVVSARDTATGPWATLFDARYGPVDVPARAAKNDRIWIESAELVTEDKHGNLTVTGARWTGLTAAGGQHD